MEFWGVILNIPDDSWSDHIYATAGTEINQNPIVPQPCQRAETVME